LNFYPLWEKESALVFQVAQELGISVLDPLPLFLSYFLPELQVSPSDGHPNAKAHAIFAEATADYILENVW
jgi:lysophospholipase L1-like esterase